MKAKSFAADASRQAWQALLGNDTAELKELLVDIDHYAFEECRCIPIDDSPLAELSDLLNCTFYSSLLA